MNYHKRDNKNDMLAHRMVSMSNSNHSQNHKLFQFYDSRCKAIALYWLLLNTLHSQKNIALLQLNHILRVVSNFQALLMLAISIRQDKDCCMCSKCRSVLDSYTNICQFRYRKNSLCSNHCLL